jgi:hypothetical protein
MRADHGGSSRLGVANHDHARNSYSGPKSRKLCIEWVLLTIALCIGVLIAKNLASA